MCQREGQTGLDQQAFNSKVVEIDHVKNKDIVAEIKRILRKE